MGMKRIVFEPYTREQIEAIVKSRLRHHTAVFQSDAVEMVARKVASLSGDVRRALQICRRAVERCREQWMKSQAAERAGGGSNGGGIAKGVGAKGKGAVKLRKVSCGIQRVQQREHTRVHMLPPPPY
jgi:hypothetical protein